MKASLALGSLALVLPAAAQSQSLPTTLGLTLAPSGRTLAVGTFDRVQVWERDATGAFQLQVFLDRIGTGTGFGVGLALDGDTLAVGAPLQRKAGEEQGAVFLFERDNGGPNAWGQVARLELTPGHGEDRFGESVVLEGDTLIVAAPGLASQTGGVFVYERGAGGPGSWELVQTLSSPAGSQSVDFGRTLELQGERLAVHGLRRLPELDGIVQVYERRSGGWVEDELLAAPSASPFFGFSLSLSDDRLAVGEHGQPSAPLAGGRVHVFERDASSWQQVATIVPKSSVAGDGFGWSLHLSSDLLIVGSPQVSVDPDETLDTGAIHLFRRGPGGAWHTDRRIDSPTIDPSIGTVFTVRGPWFGWAVDVTGGEVVTSAPFAGTERTFLYPLLPDRERAPSTPRPRR